VDKKYIFKAGIYKLEKQEKETEVKNA